MDNKITLEGIVKILKSEYKKAKDNMSISYSFYCGYMRGIHRALELISMLKNNGKTNN